MTVTEIAKLAGVSIGTVDRVLHNRGRVSPDTQKRVQAIIDNSDYQPNMLARQLKKHESYKIGVLLPEIDTGYGYWKKLYDGIERTMRDELSAFSFSIQPFFFTRSVHTSLIAQFSQMMSAGCNAYIIAPVQQEETLALLESMPEETPYCFVDCPLPEARPLCTVAQDPYKAGYLSGRLTELTANHKDGTYIVVRTYSEAFNQTERVRGFCDWFKDSGKKTKVVDMGDAMPDGIRQEIGRILKETPDACGICTVSVEVQFVAEQVVRSGAKDRIAVTGFDVVDANKELVLNGSIDCVISQQPEEQGMTAVHKLFRKLIYEDTPDSIIHIPLEIFFKENLI
ncbi:MAG: LacI family transcriptional regulator [Treponema sp.]|nr:LacI family transcriptional regulator [Treponema sp.]